MPLYKTTIVIWTNYNPSEENSSEFEDFAHCAITGDAYCSAVRAEAIDDPMSDPDWDGTEFFNDPPDLENEEEDPDEGGDDNDEGWDYIGC